MNWTYYALTLQETAECLSGVVDDHEVAAILTGNAVMACVTNQDIRDAVCKLGAYKLRVRLKTGMPPKAAAKEIARKGRARGALGINLPRFDEGTMTCAGMAGCDMYLEPGYPSAAGPVAYLRNAFKLHAKHALCEHSGKRCPALASDEIKRQMEAGLKVYLSDPCMVYGEVIPHKWFNHPPPWYTPSPDPKYIKPKQ